MDEFILSLWLFGKSSISRYWVIVIKFVYNPFLSYCIILFVLWIRKSFALFQVSKVTFRCYMVLFSELLCYCSLWYSSKNLSLKIEIWWIWNEVNTIVLPSQRLLIDTVAKVQTAYRIGDFLNRMSLFNKGNSGWPGLALCKHCRLERLLVPITRAANQLTSQWVCVCVYTYLRSWSTTPKSNHRYSRSSRWSNGQKAPEELVTSAPFLAYLSSIRNR